jgi:hypothetical protein
MNSKKIASEVYTMGKLSAFSETDIHEAIRQLRPGCTFDLTISEGNYIYHHFCDPNNSSPPTKKEVESQLKYQEECRQYYQYAYDRCHEYPDGFEQMDMLWHAINKGIALKDSEWFLTIKEIKEKYPKPEGNPPSKNS